MTNEQGRECPLLGDPDEFPTDPVVRGLLKNAFPAYKSLMVAIAEPDFGLSPEWRYYKDGKAWLCKVTRKAKTIFWISVWDGMFRASFYFTEKNRSGISDLGLDDIIKHRFQDAKPIGKLIPLVLCIASEENLEHLFRVIRYKIKVI